LMDKLVKYIERDDQEILIQTALIHAQFELIHPFLDGNGRVGRLLIPLFLFSKKYLTGPMFYISEYLEAHRDVYYLRLLNISNRNDWTGWVEFFLKAVDKQAEINNNKINKIILLYNSLKNQIVELTRSQYAILLLDAIFKIPIFSASDLVKKLKVPKQTLLPMLKKLEESKILKILRPASGRQSAIMVFEELLNISQE
jgi:Fic family protein